MTELSDATKKELQDLGQLVQGNSAQEIYWHQVLQHKDNLKRTYKPAECGIGGYLGNPWYSWVAQMLSRERSWKTIEVGFCWDAKKSFYGKPLEESHKVPLKEFLEHYEPEHGDDPAAFIKFSYAGLNQRASGDRNGPPPTITIITTQPAARKVQQLLIDDNGLGVTELSEAIMLPFLVSDSEYGRVVRSFHPNDDYALLILGKDGKVNGTYQVGRNGGRIIDPHNRQ